MQIHSQRLYIYAMYLKDGTKVHNYAATDTPPQVGDFVTVQQNGSQGKFEILDVRYESVNDFDIVILTVEAAEG